MHGVSTAGTGGTADTTVLPVLAVLAVLATRMHAFGRQKKRRARCLQNLHNCRLKVCHAGPHMYVHFSENSRAGSESLPT